jgi:hypothetical protein
MKTIMYSFFNARSAMPNAFSAVSTIRPEYAGDNPVRTPSTSTRRVLSTTTKINQLEKSRGDDDRKRLRTERRTKKPS